jgi:putative two-component system response regulator
LSSNDIQVLRSASPSNTQVKAALTRLCRELEKRFNESGSLDSMGLFLDAFKAVAGLRGLSNLEVRFECVNYCGLYFHFNDRFHESLECADELDRISRGSGLSKVRFKGASLRAVNLAEMGLVAEAVVNYSRALELVESDDRESTARVLNNLGCALNYAALHQEAIQCFTRAAELSKEQVIVDRASSNIAQAYFYLGDLERGYPFILRALADRDSRDTQEMVRRTISHFIALRFAIELADDQAAKQYSQRCMKFSRLSGTGRARGVGEIAQAMYESHFGDLHQGIRLLEALLASRGNVGSSYYIAALTYLIRAHERAGNYDLALSEMQSLLMHTRSLRMNVISSAPVPTVSIGEASDLAMMQVQESRLRAKASEARAKQSQLEMLERLAVTADLKEEASGEHGYRVGRLSALLAEKLGWAQEACHAIDLAARLHDIGKIAMPDRILFTSEQLKEAERHLMSTHAMVGAELLAKSSIPELQMAEEIARFHHEWWNGTGYPSKRREKRIPIHARIVALADVFDSLTHGRPFAEPWTMERALDELRQRRGTQFDPELTDLFLELIARLRIEHNDLDGYLGKAGHSSPFLQARHKIRLMLADTEPVASPAKSAETVH